MRCIESTGERLDDPLILKGFRLDLATANDESHPLLLKVSNHTHRSFMANLPDLSDGLGSNGVSQFHHHSLIFKPFHVQKAFRKSLFQ
jgi:hypothetical protein